MIDEEDKFKGLLYSPEVLGGIGLLTAGLSGSAPSAALPSLIQGMQTASMFKKQKSADEKAQYIKDYEDQVPPDQLAAFKAFPEEWVKQNLFAKDKTMATKTFVKKGEYKTVNVTGKVGQANADSLIEKGWVESPVKANAANADSLQKSVKTKVQTTLLSGEQLLENLTLQEIQFQPEFLTAKGKIRYEFLKKKEFVLGDKANLSKEDEAYLSNYSSWQQTNLQYFNQYRKEITGVAAGEKEMGWLQASIPSEKDTPTTYAAKLKNQISIQKQVMENAKRFQATKGAELYTTNADGERIYSEAFGKYLKTKMKPSGKFIQELYSSYRLDKLWDKERTDRFMSFTFKGNDWESILKTYLEDEKGN